MCGLVPASALEELRAWHIERVMDAHAQVARLERDVTARLAATQAKLAHIDTRVEALAAELLACRLQLAQAHNDAAHAHVENQLLRTLLSRHEADDA